MRKDMKIFIGFENRSRIILSVFLLSGFCVTAAAQQNPPTEEEQAKQLEEFILNEVDRYETTLNLEDWQVFYTDSVLHHDYNALQDELKGLRDSKVSNLDLYTQAQDKWAEQMYQAFRKFLNDDQWAKYLKQGAERDRKARERRKEKMAKAAAKLREND
jgi:hypothetical protein